MHFPLVTVHVSHLVPPTPSTHGLHTLPVLHVFPLHLLHDPVELTPYPDEHFMHFPLVTLHDLHTIPPAPLEHETHGPFPLLHTGPIVH